MRTAVSNRDENSLGLDMFNPDTDGDGVSDLLNDQDGDLVSDVIELRYNYRSDFDPLVYAEHSLLDSDQDGINNLMELQLGLNPAFFDSDSDGIPDGYEIDQLTSI